MSPTQPTGSYTYKVLLEVATIHGPWTYSVSCSANSRPEAEGIAITHIAAMSAPGAPIRIKRVARDVFDNGDYTGRIWEARGAQGNYAAGTK